MNPQVLASLIAVTGTVVVAVVGFLTTRSVTRRTIDEQRKQLGKTLAEQHDRTLNERFAMAADKLGSDKPAAVRLAGVYAMAGLADDWEKSRQSCINVLCAYLRMPYKPDPGERASAEDRLVFRADREVRWTVMRVIASHLMGPAISWRGVDLDFTGVAFDGGSFAGAVFSAGNVAFDHAEFSGAGVDFEGAVFSGGRVSFVGAHFSGGAVSFRNARFDGAVVSFREASFCGSDLRFANAEFSKGIVSFRHANLSSGQVGFANAKFRGSEVRFQSAEFGGSAVGFANAEFSGGTIGFLSAEFCGSEVGFGNARFCGAAVSFNSARFSDGMVDFSNVAAWSPEPSFDRSTPPPEIADTVKLPRKPSPASA